MIVWKGLLKKEWKLLRFSIIINLILLIVAPVLVYSISRLLEEPAFFTSLMIGIIFAHILYFPALFFESLNKEGSTQLWLYNPNSVSKMIFAKLIVSLAIFLVSLLSTILITYVVSLQIGSLNVSDVNLPNETVLAVSSIGFFSIIIIGTGLSLWILFLWTIYYSLAQRPILKHLRWPLIVAIILGGQIISNIYESAPFFKSMRELWVIEFKGFVYEMQNTSWVFHIGPSDGSSTEISVITLLIQIFIALGLFFLSTWLLNRKVEV